MGDILLKISPIIIIITICQPSTWTL